MTLTWFSSNDCWGLKKYWPPGTLNRTYGQWGEPELDLTWTSSLVQWFEVQTQGLDQTLASLSLASFLTPTVSHHGVSIFILLCVLTTSWLLNSNPVSDQYDLLLQESHVPPFVAAHLGGTNNSLHLTAIFCEVKVSSKFNFDNHMSQISKSCLKLLHQKASWYQINDTEGLLTCYCLLICLASVRWFSYCYHGNTIHYLYLHQFSLDFIFQMATFQNGSYDWLTRLISIKLYLKFFWANY